MARSQTLGARLTSPAGVPSVPVPTVLSSHFHQLQPRLHKNKTSKLRTALERLASDEFGSSITSSSRKCCTSHVRRTTMLARVRHIYVSEARSSPYKLPSRSGELVCQPERVSHGSRIQRFEIIKNDVIFAVGLSLTSFEEIANPEKRQHRWPRCCFVPATCSHKPEPPTKRWT